MSMTSKKVGLSPMTASIISSLGRAPKSSKKLTARELPYKDGDTEVDLLMVAYGDMVEGRITRTQLIEACILWAWHYAFIKDGYMPEPLPAKSLGLVKFDNLTPADIKAMNSATVDKLAKEKMEYLDKMGVVINTNQSNRDWLLKMADYFRYKEDWDKQEQINNRIKLYEGMV